MDKTDSLIDSLRKKYHRHHRLRYRVVQIIAILSVAGLIAWLPRLVL